MKTKKHKHWNKADLARLGKYFRAGMTDAQMAEKLRRTETGVKVKRVELGFRKRKLGAGYAPVNGNKKRPAGRPTIRLEYPSGHVLTGSVGKATADELALRILAGDA